MTTTTTTVAITGNTYPVRTELKALGGRWNPADKAWMVPADRADEARALVAPAPAPARVEKIAIGTVGEDGLIYRGGGKWTESTDARWRRRRMPQDAYHDYEYH